RSGGTKPALADPSGLGGVEGHQLGARPDGEAAIASRELGQLSWRGAWPRAAGGCRGLELRLSSRATAQGKTEQQEQIDGDPSSHAALRATVTTPADPGTSRSPIPGATPPAKAGCLARFARRSGTHS